jgi:xylan 1,4-beta-xylosidase
LELKGLRGRKRVLVSQITEELGSAGPAWKAMGSPEYPSREQISQLRAAAELGEPTLHVLSSGDSASVTVDLPGNGLALIELES